MEELVNIRKGPRRYTKPTRIIMRLTLIWLRPFYSDWQEKLVVFLTTFSTILLRKPLLLINYFITDSFFYWGRVSNVIPLQPSFNFKWHATLLFLWNINNYYSNKSICRLSPNQSIFIWYFCVYLKPYTFYLQSWFGWNLIIQSPSILCQKETKKD